MTVLKRNFIKGRMNKDLDERLVPDGEYRDALNVEILTSEGSDIGSLQTSLGNNKLSTITLPGQECVGSIADEKNNKIYWFIAGNSLSIKLHPDNNIHEVHQDAILEYDILTDTITPVLVDNYAVQTTLEDGTTAGNYGYTTLIPMKDVGGMRPGMKLKVYDSSGDLINPDFLGIAGQHAPSSNYTVSQDIITMGVFSTPTVKTNLDFTLTAGEEDKLTLIFESSRVLNFDKSRMITGINLIDGMLFWTDNSSEPKKINIQRCKEGNDNTLFIHPHQYPSNNLNSTAFIVDGAPIAIHRIQDVNINHPYGYPKIISEEDITVIKKSPTTPPTLTLNNWLGRDSSFNGTFVKNPGSNNAPEPLIVGETKSVTLDQSSIRYPVGRILLSQQASINNGVVDENNYSVKAKVVSGAPQITTPASWTLTGGTTVANVSVPPTVNYAPPWNIIHYANRMLIYSPNTSIVPGQLVCDSNGNPIQNLMPGAPPEIFVESVLQFGSGLPQVVMLTGNNLNWQPGGATYAATIPSGAYVDVQFQVYTPPIVTTDHHWLKILEIHGVTTTADETWNIIENPHDKIFEHKFPRFAYRYKYEDGEYSAMSPFSDIAFLPHENGFDYHPKKGYNLGMTNGLVNLVVGSWNPKDRPLEVKEIQVLYKQSNSPNIYAVQNFKRNDWEWNQSIYSKGIDTKNNGYLSINSEMIHHAIESNQILRPWDNVPRKALAQEITGNRLVYGNYLQNYDQEIDNVSIEATIQSQPITGVSHRTGNSTAEKSLKSFREYQVGVVYRDEYGREAPVLSPSSGPVKIQKDFSRYSNIIEAKINHLPPSWATSFKYFVKETSNQYYNLAIDRYYDADDESIWLSFPSEDRNKIDDDTTIILKKGHDEDRNIIVPQEKFKVLSIKNEAPEFIKVTRQQIGSLQTGTQQSVTSGSFFKSPGGNIGLPLNGINYFYIDIADHLGGINNDIPIPGWEGSPFAYLQTRANNGVFENRLTTNVSYQVRFKTSQAVSGLQGKTKWYDVSSITYSSVNEMEIHTAEDFEDDIEILRTDPDADPIHVGVIRSGIEIEFARLSTINRAEFEGRFFVKVHKSSTITNHILTTSTEEDVVVRSQATRWAARSSTKDNDSNPESTPKYVLRYNPHEFTASSFSYITYAPRVVGIVEEDGSGQNEVTYFNGPNTSSYTDSQTGLELHVGTGINSGPRTSSLGTGGNGTFFGATTAGATRVTPGTGVWINKWASTTVLGNGSGGYDYCQPWRPSGSWNTVITNFGNIGSQVTPSDTNLAAISINGFWFIDQEPTYQVLTDDSNKYQYVKNSLGYNDQDNTEFGVVNKHWEVFSDTGIGAVAGSNQMDISFTSWVMDPTDEDAFNDPGKWDLVRDCPKAKPMVDQLQPGKKFRWAEDPRDNIYTILSVEKSYHFNYGYNPDHEENKVGEWRNAHDNCEHHRKRARFRLTLDKTIAPLTDDYVPTNPPNTSGPSRGGTGMESMANDNIRATMIFMENRLDDYVEMASNPAIFETEPKEDLGLDIYHEVGQAFPIKITTDTSNQYIKPGATLPYIFDVAEPKKITRRFALLDGGQPSMLTYYPAGPGRAGDVLFMESNDGIEIGMAVFGSVYENNDPAGNILEDTYLGIVTHLNTGNTYLNYERVRLANISNMYSPTYTASIGSTRKMPVPDTDMVFTNLPVVESVEAETGPYEKYGDTKSVKITTSVPLSASTIGTNPYIGDTLTFRNPDGYEVTTTLTETNTSPWDEIYVSPITHGQTQQLQYSNCLSFGNGVESNRIKDLYNEVFIDKGVKASTTLEHPFEEDHRSNSLIFSGIYNSISETNNLNQFIAAEDITKSLSPTYGSLQKLHSRDTDLIALCEDKVLKILANKDALYNADDTRNITANPNVLGQSIPFIGEFGISKNPESFISREFRAYFTDAQRGAVMRLSRDGLTAISEHGMKSWFRDNLPSTQNQIIQDPYLTNSEHWDTTIATITEDYSGKGVLAGVDANATIYAGYYQELELVDGKQYTLNVRFSERDEGGDTGDIRYFIYGGPGGVNSYRPLGSPVASNGNHTHTFTFNSAENNYINSMWFYVQFTNGEAYTKSIRIEYVSLIETSDTTKLIGSYDSRKALYNVSIKNDSAAPVITEKLGPELIANGNFLSDSDNWELNHPTGGSGTGSLTYTGWAWNNSAIEGTNVSLYSAVVQSNVSIVSSKKYRVRFTLSDYVDGEFNIVIINENGDHAAFPVVTANGDYSYDVGASTSYPFVQASYRPSSIYFQNKTSDGTATMRNVSVREIIEIKTDPNNATVSFSETAKGWVSFKSYIPESGLSINSEFYTFKDGNIWRHHSNDTRNNFYDVQYDSSLSVLVNESPDSVKTFSTLSYTGSQSKINANLKDNNHHNLIEEDGWYVNYLTTDIQEGKVSNFIEKEGTWFNYIQGLETTIDNLNTKEFSVQGIGKPSNVTIT